MKFSLLTIAGLSVTISCFMISAHSAPTSRKRKVAKKGEGSANDLPTLIDPKPNDQLPLINLDSTNCDPNCGGTKTEGQPCFGGQSPQGLCIDGLYCYISGTTTVDDENGGAFCCPEGKAPTNVNTCGDRPPPPLPPSTAPGPFGWQKSAGGDGMTYHGSRMMFFPPVTESVREARRTCVIFQAGRAPPRRHAPNSARRCGMVAATPSPDTMARRSR